MQLSGFVGPTYQSLSPAADCEVCFNLYPEFIDGGATGKNKMVYCRVPGRTLFGTLPTAPIRCLVANEDRLFAVAGDTAYELNRDGTIRGTASGALNDDGNPSQIIFNGSQAFITSGQQGYITNDGGNTIVPAHFWDADSDTPTGPLLPAAMAAFLDNYYIAMVAGSKSFFVSDPAPPVGLGGSKWDTLQDNIKQSSPDNCAAIIESHQELRIMGTAT